MTLPTNIDATYPDQSVGDAAHQQHHDEIHGKVNRIPTGTSPVLTEATGNAAYPPLAKNVVQVVRATLALNASTTLASPQTTGLEATITPLYADSVLIVEVDGEANAYAVAGSPVPRRAWYEIYDSTALAVVARQVRGRTLIGASSASAVSNYGIALKAFNTPGSTAARTFQLRHESIEATNIESIVLGTRTGGVVMTITEVRP